MKRRALVLTVLATAVLLLLPGVAAAAPLDIVSLASSAVQNANGWSDDPTITFTYAAEDPGSVAGYSWDISTNPGVDPDEEVDTRETLFTRPDIEGHYYLAVKATNGTGDWGAKMMVEVRNDSVAPSVEAVSFNDDDPTQGVVDFYYSAQITVGWITLVLAQVSPIDLEELRVDAGDWSPTLTVPAPANHSNDGEHTARMRVTDAAGNVGLSPIRSFAIDTRVPSTTLTPQDGQWHAAADYAFSATDALSGVDTGVGYGGISVTRGAQPVALVQDGIGSDWHLPASFPEGSSSIQYWATDVAGNVEPAAAATIDVDETPPVSSVSGADALWHGDPVQLTFIAFDEGSGVATQESRIDGGPWVEGATRTVGAPASHANDGVHTIDFRATDVAGNREDFKSVEVKIDTTAPVTTRTGGGAAWAASPAVVQFTATDVLAGVAYTEYRLDGGSWVAGGSVSVSAEGEHSVDFRSVDSAGNTEEFKTVAVKVDGTPPVTGDDTDGLWHADAVPVTLTPSDALSGVAQTEYRIDGGGWQVGTTFNVTGAGQHAVVYRSTDNAGNVEADQSATVRIDAVAPVTTQSGADALWHQTPVTVTFDASDDVSGIADTEYRVDDGEWTSGTEVTVEGDGTHNLRYRSRDVAGNVEAANLVEVKIDATPPTTAEDAPAGWINDSLLVRLTPTDAVSGMSGGSAATRYSMDSGTTWKLGRRLIFAVDAAGHTTDGEHGFLYRSTDAAGNAEEAKSFTIRVDTRKPTPKAPYRASVRRLRTATLKYSVADTLPCGPTVKVIIKIKTLGGRTVKTLRYAKKAINTPLTARFVCKLRKRTYRFYIYATDAGGNTQSRVARNTLVVR